MRKHARAFALILIGVAASPLHAEPPKTSVDLAPDDSELFVAVGRVRERFDWLARSGAVQRLVAAPVIREAWEKAKKENEFRQFLQFFQRPDVIEAWLLLRDLGSDEVSLILGPGWANFAQKANEASFQMRARAIASALTRQPFSTTDIVQTYLVSFADFQLSTLAFAFKADVGDRLEKRLAKCREQLLEIKAPGVVIVGKPGERVRWAWRVTGKDLRLTKEHLAAMARKEHEPAPDELVEPLLNWLLDRKLEIAFARHGDYWIASIGADDSLIRNWGAPHNLGASAAFAPVRELKTGAPVESVSYISQTLSAVNHTDFTGTVDRFKTFAPLARPFAPPGLVDRVVGDLEGVARDLDATMPQPSEAVSVGYTKGDTAQDFTFSQPGPGAANGAQPLQILQHAPPGAALVAAATSDSSLPGYRKSVAFVKKLFGYWKDFGRAAAPKDRRNKIDDVEKLVLEFAGKLDAILSEKLLPSIDECQTLFVVDLHSRSELPGFDGKLPIPNLAIAMTVRDRSKLLSGVHELVELIHATLDKLPQIDENVDEKITQFRIPAPKIERSAKGSRYSYAIPALDEALQPNAHLTDALLVLSTSAEVTERVLKGSRVADPGGLGLSEASSSVALFTSAPWIAAGREWSAALAGKSADLAPLGTVGPLVLDVVGLLKQANFRTYYRDGLCVSRSWVQYEHPDAK